MLRINQQKDAKAARSYFTSKAEYYRGGQQELPGTWGGNGAELLGLDGEVSKQAFDALTENRNPITGGKLTPRDRKGRTVGYDFNFHCPKSLSLLYALAGDETILAAFQEALALTLAEMETAMQTRVRKAGQMANRTTGHALWSQHVHLTARPVEGEPDPHLHAHIFLFNATFDGVERQWKAAMVQDIYRDAPYYQAVFHGHLAKSLADLGYPIERTATGWEIAGLASLLPRFSRRTEEIERLAAERGITDPALKSELGAATRKHKQKDLSMAELRQRWLARLDDAERRALPASAARPGGSSAADAVDRAVAAGIRASFAKGHALVPEKRLLAAALNEGHGLLTADTVRNRLPAHGIVFRDYDGKRFCARFDAGQPGDAELRERQEFILNRQRRAMLDRQPPYQPPPPRRAYGR